MKKRSAVSLTLVAVLTACSGSGGSSAGCGPSILSCVDISALSVAQYKDDKAAAASFTFDDGSESDYKVVAPFFEKFGYRASFYVIAENNNDTTWGIWRSVSARGHEIGNHSFTHIRLDDSKLTAKDLNREINQAQACIQSHIGKVPLVFAFPGNRSDAQVVDLVMAHHIATRTTTFPLGNKYKVFNYDHTTTVDSANKVLRLTIERGGWFVAAGHGVDTGYEPVKIDVLEGQLQYATDHASELWVDTYEHVAKYQLERVKASVYYNAISGAKVGISLQVDKPATEFDFPLTVVVPLRQPAIANFSAADDVGNKLPTVLSPDGKNLLIEMPPNSHAVLESSM